MEIKIAGHSGCQVSVERRNGELRVIKQTADSGYFKRLLRQADKQKLFLDTNTLPQITAPQILERIESDECCGMEMEYIHSKTFIDFFENSSCHAPSGFCRKIIAFLEDEFKRSPLQDISSALLQEKLQSVRENIAKNDLLNKDSEIAKILEKADDVFSRTTKRCWPVGVCHGDLTMSNLLFQDAQIYMIDFLDSFLETPLMDLVKLRQDTRYFWSHLLYKGAFDRVKNYIVMEYIDKHLWTHFQNYPGVAEGYYELQFMNFLRILQYAHDPEVITYLKHHLNTLAKGDF